MKYTSNIALCSGLILAFNLNAKINQRPNIIHIMCDDHAFQAISAYGGALSKFAPTPNIDRLANEGMIFQRAYVENSLSAPSRATLLTGLYSHQHGQKTLGKGFDESLPVFPELLQQSGYQTSIFGKWHLNCEPKGFDDYKILLDQGDYYNPEFKSKGSNGKYIREEGYATTLITDYALNWLSNRNKKKPFCLMLHHKAPHRNWMPEEKYLNLYNDVEFPYPSTLNDDYATRSDAAKSQEMSILKDMTYSYDLKIDQLAEGNDSPALVRYWEKIKKRMNPAQHNAWVEAYTKQNDDFVTAKLKGDDLLKLKYQRYMRDYLRCVKSVDDQVGRVLNYLEKEGLLNNTIIVYTSDQGFYLGEHSWFDKRFMYEESYRTPLIIRYPKMINKGLVNTDLVQNIDFAPTYLELAGLKSPKLPGLSLMSLFKGKTPANWRNELYYHYYDYLGAHKVRKHEGISTNRYKLIRFYGDGFGKDKGENIDAWEMYDLVKDPNELNNVADNSTYQNELSDLKIRLSKKRIELNIKE